MKKILFISCGAISLKSSFSKCNTILAKFSYFQVESCKKYFIDNDYQVYTFLVESDYEKYKNIKFDAIFMASHNYCFIGGKFQKKNKLVQNIIINHDGDIFIYEDDPKNVVENGASFLLNKPEMIDCNYDILTKVKDKLNTGVICIQPGGYTKIKESKRHPLNIKEYIHPFEIYRYSSEMVDNNYHTDIKEDFKADIVYAGILRKERKDLIKKYFNSNKFTSGITFWKSDCKEDIELPSLKLESFPYEQSLEWHSNFRSQLLVLDNEHIDKTVTLRLFVALKSKCPIFIPIEIDSKKKIFAEDTTLQDFCYIYSVEDLENKISLLKKYPEFRIELIHRQEKISNPTFMK